MKRHHAIGWVALLGLGVSLATPAVPFQGDEDSDPVVTLLDGRQVRSAALDCFDLQIHTQIEAERLKATNLRASSNVTSEAPVFAPLYAARCNK
ncbi:hypothetical protein [Rhodobacter sp. JA431]|uniref:hypothetical protein n=1 Tax=Rhodobacter sp. JA431 TaxID=570013 RepID=UPI000BE35DD2|nr:hypothetical protein [Rhodobacter sp. JA431]